MAIVYGVDHDHGVPARESGELRDGKGAGIAEMTSLGFDVGGTETVDEQLPHLARLERRAQEREGASA